MKTQGREVLKHCLHQEKNGLELYREAARLAKRDRTRRAFEILIQEEEEHIRRLFEQYRGDTDADLDTFLFETGEISSPVVMELKNALDPDLPDRKAMEIAMRLESQNLEEYRRRAAETPDEECRDIYNELARDEEKHYEVLEAEYAHLMAMVHETDVNTYVRE